MLLSSLDSAKAIKGIPAVEHDPIVRLPVLEMDIPRVWLGQTGYAQISGKSE